jgi:hypothetical protein
MISENLKFIQKAAFLLAVFLSILAGCAREFDRYRTFADYPGFKEYYDGRCQGDHNQPVSNTDLKQLERFRPHLIIPPGGRYPIDFYREYIPYTILRRYSDGQTVTNTVTPELLKSVKSDTRYYLDFQFDRYQAGGLDRKYHVPFSDKKMDDWKSTVYGRVYHETVAFPTQDGQTLSRQLTFLKYNLIFAVSGLPAKLPSGFEPSLRLVGLDPVDWHQLDNFVAIHIVLDERENPIAAILAQHNHHRTYLIGKDIDLMPDGRIAFDVALRSNEVYPGSDAKEPEEHRVIRWDLYLKYLLSGEDPPFFRGYDITYGIQAGGNGTSYNLIVLSSCDPLYTAKIMLGRPRPFFGQYIGRDGPPGSDYYTIPSLLPPGNLLKLYYLHDGDTEDIRTVSEAIDLKGKSADIDRLLHYGGSKFISDLNGLAKSTPSRKRVDMHRERTPLPSRAGLASE